jgi:phosphoglycerol transferase
LSHVPAFLHGESQSAYVGMVAGSFLIVMFTWGTINIAARRFDRVACWYWLGLATLAFAVYGGVNYLLGAFGFVLLRSTNRLSIFLMAIALLYACEVLSRSRWRVGLAGTLIVATAIGAWDQIPRPDGIGVSLEQAKANEARYLADSKMTNELERRLVPGSMVFQLPVMPFPEGPPRLEMGSYENFRPFIQSTHLRFSYGAIKGRGDDEWQIGVAAQKPANLIQSLEEYGFSALMINRKGFADHAILLSTELQRLGYVAAWDSGDFLVYFLQPSNK